MDDDVRRRFEDIERKHELHKHETSDGTTPLRASRSYCGRVNSGGTAAHLPDGWTCTNTAAGNYTITHNLGHTNYGVMTTPDITGSFDTAYTAGVKDRTATSFKVNTVLVGGGAYTDQNIPFMFTLTTIPVV